jgi:hypothetical protein
MREKRLSRGTDDPSLYVIGGREPLDIPQLYEGISR